ncbi:MAG TPA: hypothetical protein VM327_07365, partial [Candidatus Thermoplasmatota archaeon]|nr:hypothetical protein [Candidatus Thermoplasmatota archaeon]
MRVSLALLAVALLLAGCSGGAKTSAAPADDAVNPGVVLGGVVVDDAIRPLEGVRVELDGGPNATTDAKGEFRFGG